MHAEDKTQPMINLYGKNAKFFGTNHPISSSNGGQMALVPRTLSVLPDVHIVDRNISSKSLLVSSNV